MTNQIYFTSDTHLGHGRIIEYCNRPFPSSAPMDEAILANFNEVLRPGDRLYHLGDVCWSSFPLTQWLSRLNTKEIFLIKGNHDNKKDSEYVASGFRWAKDYATLTIDSTQVALSHYPMRSWEGKSHGGLHLYGHVHGRLPDYDRSMDVGVDVGAFRPWSWYQIKARLGEVPIFNSESRKEMA